MVVLPAPSNPSIRTLHYFLLSLKSNNFFKKLPILNYRKYILFNGKKRKNKKIKGEEEIEHGKKENGNGRGGDRVGKKNPDEYF